MGQLLGGTLITLLFAALFCVVWRAAAAEEQTWQTFKVEHNCKITTVKESQAFTAVGVGTNGSVAIVTGLTPSQNGWTCDNGITYFR
jgi:hypothetical protein